MKQTIFFLVLSFYYNSIFSQNVISDKLPNDTIRIGNFKLIKLNTDENKDWITVLKTADYKSVKINYTPRKIISPKELETSWFAFDIGVANYMDYTKYDITSAFTKPAVGISVNKKKMQPRNSSSNFNLWVVQQKLNLYKHSYYLKYGVGFEMFNFYYSYGVNFRNNEKMYVSLSDSIYQKNKLFINYLTVPIMISHSLKLKKSQNINLAAGLSVGYLLDTRNKQINESLGKKKYDGDFNFSDYRMAGIFQVDIGEVKFYGSASFTNTLDKTLTTQSFYPYTFGVRFSRF